MNAFLDVVVSLEDMRLRVRHQYEWIKLEEWEFEGVQNPYTTLWLVMGGERDLQLDEQAVRIGSGDLVIIPSYTSISLRCPVGSKTPLHYYSMGCEWKQEGFEFVQIYQFPKVTHLEPAQFQSLKESWANLYTSWILFTETLSEHTAVPKVNDWLERTNAILLRIDLCTDQAEVFFKTKRDLFHWLAFLFRLLRDRIPAKPAPVDERVQKVCRMVGDRYAANLNMKELCDTVFLSESQLRVLFKKTLHISPMEYLRDIRLKKAKELLILTNKPVGLIAQECGFEDVSYFSRMFRKKERISPKEYRRKNVSYATLLGE
jgi:AraC-like DNA-binding protein/mannose-6-phosphate isomerase-like protein (cupin superfamily)